MGVDGEALVLPTPLVFRIAAGCPAGSHRAAPSRRIAVGGPAHADCATPLRRLVRIAGGTDPPTPATGPASMAT